MFGQSFIMTRGQPGQETRTAIYHIAETGLQNFRMGEAAASQLGADRGADADLARWSSGWSANAESGRKAGGRA